MRTRAIIYYWSQVNPADDDLVWLLASVRNRREFRRTWAAIRNSAMSIDKARTAVVDIDDDDYRYIKRLQLIEQRGRLGGYHAYYRLADIEGCLRLEFTD